MVTVPQSVLVVRRILILVLYLSPVLLHGELLHVRRLEQVVAELAHMVLVLLLLLDDCRILDRIVGLLLLLLLEVSVITMVLVMLGTCVVLIDVRLLVF